MGARVEAGLDAATAMVNNIFQIIFFSLKKILILILPFSLSLSLSHSQKRIRSGAGAGAGVDDQRLRVRVWERVWMRALGYASEWVTQQSFWGYSGRDRGQLRRMDGRTWGRRMIE